jgi:SagB-type dehydrogenase family enzyme
MDRQIGDNFQEKTKYTRNKPSGHALSWQDKPNLYKEYPDATVIKLTSPVIKESPPLIEILKKRKSIRSFSDKELSLEHLSFLLWATNGISHIDRGFEFRTAPSAGALYPIETYLTINNVKGLDKGIYHYHVKTHRLELLKKGDFGKVTAYAALDQEMCAAAPVVFIWTAIFERSKWKYGQRAYRYVYLDAGHIAENLALAAESTDLGTCQIAALYDDEVNSILEIDGTVESVIYMSVAGYPR